jgi:UDP-sugar transporter A1/2/3
MVLKSSLIVSPNSNFNSYFTLTLTLGIAMSTAACYGRDFDEIIKRGSFFEGYNKFVWGVIILQAAGGLIVAVVVKYADNVMKGFATSISILISCVFSSYLFHDIDVNTAFTTGACVVLISVFAFGYTPTVPSHSITGINKAMST